MPSEPLAAFVSYCRADSDFALQLVQDLKSAGANVWLDQLEIAPGAAWDLAVEQALARCPCFLVLLSPAAVSSENVRDEISYALNKQKRVIPLVYKDCDIPFRLGRQQYVDLRQDYRRAIQALLRSLGVEREAKVSAAGIATSPADATVPAAPVIVHHEQTDAKSTLPTVSPGEPPPQDVAPKLASSLAAPFRWVRVAPLVIVVGLAVVVAVKSVVNFVNKSGAHFSDVDLSSIVFADAHSGWAVGGGAILHTSDGGVSWQSQGEPAPGVHLNAAAFTSANSGWVVGDKGTVLHTEDGGKNWQTQVWDTGRLTSISFGTPQSGWILGQRTLLHTTDSGATWQPQSIERGGFSVSFPTPQQGWIAKENASGYNMLHTSDGGRHWEFTSNATSNHLYYVRFQTAQIGWVVGGWSSIRQTQDGGRTWLERYSDMNEVLNCITFPDPLNGWAVGSSGIILHTSDGGRTWLAQRSGTAQALSSVAFVDANQGWAVGHRAFLHTNDGGKRWIPQ